MWRQKGVAQRRKLEITSTIKAATKRAAKNARAGDSCGISALSAMSMTRQRYWRCGRRGRRMAWHGKSKTYSMVISGMRSCYYISYSMEYVSLLGGSDGCGWEEGQGWGYAIMVALEGQAWGGAMYSYLAHPTYATCLAYHFLIPACQCHAIAPLTCRACNQTAEPWENRCLLASLIISSLGALAAVAASSPPAWRWRAALSSSLTA